MFTPGHLHRSNLALPEQLRHAPPFTLDFYYEVRLDSQQGPMLHMRLVGDIDGRPVDEAFELHRDLAFNFASAVSRVAAKHGLPPNAGPIMRGHTEYDRVFEDILEKLQIQPGDPVDLEHIG